MINNISIKNFRSIDNLNFSCESLTTFVGPNDAGKSNILRALNLFFNENTDHDVTFNFDKDFNKYAKTVAKQAKQVEIELTITLPDSFQRKGRSKEVTWRKVWREGGLHLPLLRQRYLDGSKFSSYSKIPTFLERLAFYYVPAIKDRHFFTDLQGHMYDILAEAAESKLRISAKDFESSIQTHITELMDLVSGQFGENNEIRLPENMRIIFEALEFNADEIPLSRRGDGIKVRHIPMILKFLGDKRNALLTSGAIKYTNIWGFEEPENNVELSAAFEMARGFESEAKNGCQIFLTTHSPAFYAVGQEAADDQEIASSVYGVRKEGNASLLHSDLGENLHDEMGLMPLIAKHVKDEQNRWSKVIEEKDLALDNLRKDADQSTPRMFVEGSTDKRIFKKTLQVFFPDADDKIKIDAGGKEGYGSASAVVSRALAWQLIQQTKPEPFCPAAAVFDGDSKGRESEEELELLIEKLNNSKRKIAKSFLLKPSKRIGLLKKAGFTLANDLESYYPDSIWQHALDQGWLEKANLSDQLSTNKIDLYLSGEKEFLDKLQGLDRIRVFYRWKDNSKSKAADYVCSLNDAEVQSALKDVADALRPCIAHLYSEPTPK